MVEWKNVLVGTGYNDDVVVAMSNLYEQYKDLPFNYNKTRIVANSGMDVDGMCQSVFGYLEDCKVSYWLDPGDSQLIRTPERLIAEGCGDCKSLTMFIACCLHCLGISHKIRFVSFDNTNIYTHVYAVALDERGEEIILDACEVDPKGARIYDYARPYTHKKDLIYYE